MGKGKKVEFIEEGVIFTFPEELIDVYVERLVHIPDNKLPPASGGFINPNRSVINVRLYHKDDPDTDITEFEKPFKLQVYFKQRDETHAGDIKKMQLAFHSAKTNEKKKTWELFTYNKHGFKKHKKSIGNWKGHGLATKISTWPDPVIAWGP
jgi:hypothetical protein